MDVGVAAAEIVYAIRKKRTFYTFPRRMRWSMGILTMLPRSWQDRYIRSVMKRIKTKKPEQTPG